MTTTNPETQNQMETTNSRTQVNIKSGLLRGILDEQSERLGVGIKECAETLVKKGLNYDRDLAMERKNLAETKQVLETLRTKAKLLGIDLDRPIQDSIDAQKSSELGIIDMQRKVEELDHIKAERDGLNLEIESIKKKLKREKKRRKKLEQPNLIDKLFEKAEDNPNTFGMLIQQFTGSNQQQNQLGGVTNEVSDEAMKLYRFFVGNFKTQEEQSMMIDIMQRLATDKQQLTLFFNQTTNSNAATD